MEDNLWALVERSWAEDPKTRLTASQLYRELQITVSSVLTVI